MTGPGGTGHGPEPHGRAGHETGPDYVDKDLDRASDVERQGDYTDADVDPGAPELDRQGDYTDRDVTADDTDTPPGGYTRRDAGS